MGCPSGVALTVTAIFAALVTATFISDAPRHWLDRLAEHRGQFILFCLIASDRLNSRRGVRPRQIRVQDLQGTGLHFDNMTIAAEDNRPFLVSAVFVLVHG